VARQTLHPASLGNLRLGRCVEMRVIDGDDCLRGNRANKFFVLLGENAGVRDARRIGRTSPDRDTTGTAR
jgi:hypothetical protein